MAASVDSRPNYFKRNFTDNSVMRMQRRKFHPQHCSNAVSLNCNNSTDDLDNNHLKMELELKHRLHCPGYLDCSICQVQTTGFASRCPVSGPVTRGGGISKSSVMNIDDKGEDPKSFLQRKLSSNPHECPDIINRELSDKYHQKTLTSSCDVNNCNFRKTVSSKATEPCGMMSSWKWEVASKMHRFITRFSGRRRRSRKRVFSWLPVVQWTRMTSFLYTIFIVVTTCLPNLPVSYACSSRSTPKPRPPSPTLRPNITIQTYTCPPEYDAHYCLNGATCFTVKIGESILYNCECAEGYMGQRCEFKDLDGSYLPSKQRAMLEQAGVTGGAAIIIILVVIVCFYLYVRSRRKSKIRRRRDADVTDGIDVDYERYERRPFSQFYYNNPNLSISQNLHNPSTLHHQSDTSGRLEKVDIRLPSSSPRPHCLEKVEPPDPEPTA